MVLEMIEEIDFLTNSEAIPLPTNCTLSKRSDKTGEDRNSSSKEDLLLNNNLVPFITVL